MLKADKRLLRKAISSTLWALAPQDIQAQSQAVTHRVLALPAFQACQTVSCYLSMPSGELDTSTLVAEILKAGKTLFVPKVDVLGPGSMDLLKIHDTDDLQSLPAGVWGIKEPTSHYNQQPRLTVMDPRCEDLDLILVPGVAFDHSLSRLGHGKGYYDRFISSYSEAWRKRPLLVALALREQIVDENNVPVGDHDWKMDLVISPDGIIKPSGA
ncbi:hypothetical protein HGRIS_011318 [Hohenbuehelia grisea]|uniref:5-formyltetrahydrofolate cyclo-ligase n=1 Tax=Hohenbuehelia grisea TaxID=104357 RepID=A0ABR3JUP9_9AGAR